MYEPMGTSTHDNRADLSVMSSRRRRGYLTVRISDELEAELRKLADTNERSKSAEARLAIRAWLAKESG